MRTLRLAAMMLVFAWAPSHAETTGEQAKAKAPAKEKPRKAGYYVGGIRYLPRIEVSGAYNSNIFATDSERVSDFINVVRTNLAARSDWDKHSLRFDLGGEIGSYWDTPKEDYKDYWLDLRGRYDLSSRTNLFGGIGYSFLHESRDSPDANVSGVEPTTFQSKNAHLGLAHALENYAFRIGGTFEKLNFDEVPTLFGGSLPNDSRDRSLTGLGARAVHNLNETTDLFAQFLYDKRDYDRPTDQNGFRKDSDGYRAALGIRKRLKGLGRFEASAGLMTQDYDEREFNDLQKPDFSGALTLYPSARSKLVANLDRELYETTQAGSAGYVLTSVGGRLEYRLMPRLTGRLRGSYSEADYLAMPRKDDNYSFGLGLKYQLTPHLFLATDYLWNKRDSNDKVLGGGLAPLSNDFSQNQFLLTLGVTPYPKFEPAMSNTSVDGYVELGAIWVSDESLWFGQYTGLTEDEFYALANLDATAKIDNTTRTRLLMEDMGLESRSIHFSWSEWERFRAFVSWDELPNYRHKARVVFREANTPNLTVPENWFDNVPPPINTTRDMDKLFTSLNTIDIRTKRKQLGFGGRLKLKAPWVIDGSFKSIKKQGLRPLGGALGTSPGNTRASLLPEPVDWTDRQLDFSLGYGGKSGQIDLKYHGSFFRNAFDALRWESPFSGLGNARFTNGQLSLTPKNQFHQISLSGNYLLSPSTRTRLSAVYSYGLMLQDDSFLPYTINPGGAFYRLPSDRLDGKVAVQNAVVTLVSRPVRKLRLNASYRLNDRDNKTERQTFDYVTADSNPSQTTTVRNNPYSYTRNRWNVDAKYRLHHKADLVLGYDNEEMKRHRSERRRTDEDTYRAELRLRPIAKVQASLNFRRSERDGSKYESEPGENPLLRKYNMADRDRDKGGITVSYQPWDFMSVSASANKTDDDYDNTEIGLTNAKRLDFNIDTSVQVSQDANAYAFYNWESIKADQVGSESASVPDWKVDFDDRIDSIGVGIKKDNLLPKVDVTLDYVYSNANGDRDIVAPNSLVPALPYPDVSTKVHTVKLSANYRYKKKTNFRLGYEYEKYSSDDWAVDDIRPNSLRNVLTIDTEAPNYSIHTLTAAVTYKF